MSSTAAETATAVEATATAVSACWYSIVYEKMTKSQGQLTGRECNEKKTHAGNRRNILAQS
jgi:hypothetical protein